MTTHDFHKKAGTVILKQGQLQLRLYITPTNVNWVIDDPALFSNKRDHLC